ncbi:anti-sigma factor A [Vibrio phage 1.081.O._10N.286.52.C2]|nr:anti-sigma factor A [Vibrio phage 1.081.O._10N.286.52.C2]
MIESKNTTNEIALEIAAFASLLVKLGFDECVENQKLFVEMCNETGIRTSTGKEFTQMSFRQMFARLPAKTAREVREIFSWGVDHQNESILETIN